MKKIILLQLAVLISIGSLVGCGDWSQDPLAKAKGSLGEGQSKPDVKPEKPALPDDYILMEAPLFKLAKEGEEVQVKLDARVVLPNYTLVVQVRNISQFEGATFDSTTNTFKWTPPVGTASNDISEMSLEFAAVATAPGQVAVSKLKVTNIGVVRTLLEPTITQVTSIAAEIREGKSDYFYVTVEDRTAGPTEAEYPRLLARSTQGVGSIADYTEIAKPTKESATQFRYKVRIDLANAELTTSRTEFGFEMVPISKFEKAGAARVVTYDVLTSLSKVTSTWQTPITAGPGGKIDYQFLVLDPKQEGNVSFLQVTQGPTGSLLTCANTSQPVLACRFTWDVPVSASGSYSAKAQFKNASSDYYDSYTQLTNLVLPLTISTTVSGGRK